MMSPFHGFRHGKGGSTSSGRAGKQVFADLVEVGIGEAQRIDLFNTWL
jgi:hypothetical protein